jgi:hypothetical protein
MDFENVGVKHHNLLHTQNHPPRLTQEGYYTVDAVPNSIMAGFHLMLSERLDPSMTNKLSTLISVADLRNPVL